MPPLCGAAGNKASGEEGLIAWRYEVLQIYHKIIQQQHCQLAAQLKMCPVAVVNKLQGLFSLQLLIFYLHKRVAVIGVFMWLNIVHL